MSSSTAGESLYSYDPSRVLPAVFLSLISASWGMHISQNFMYRHWRVTFFMFYGGAVFLSGWAVRSASVRRPEDLGLYIAQYMLIIMAAPIYAATEYNILGRLMRYVPMHAPLNPGRVVYFFIYLGAAVEVLTAIGAGRIAGARDDKQRLKTGASFMVASVVLQIFVEGLFIYFVALMHHRCVKSKILASNIRSICIMLYGTSALVILRCAFRAAEKINIFQVVSSDSCEGTCASLLNREWYLYAFEAAPMVLYTYWLNIMHPGRYLPSSNKRYLDFDGKTERLGPGWVDKRPWIMTMVDPLDLEGLIKGENKVDRFWERPADWEVADEGRSFATGRQATWLEGGRGRRLKVERGVGRR